MTMVSELRDGDESALHAMKEEAQVEAGPLMFRAPLGPGETIITVPSSEEWPSSAMTALNAGSFDLWAEKILDEENLGVWLDVDPTMGQIMAFVEELTRIGCFDFLTNRASRRSRRNTRRS
jgi:hypothetical protein